MNDIILKTYLICQPNDIRVVSIFYVSPVFVRVPPSPVNAEGKAVVEYRPSVDLFYLVSFVEIATDPIEVQEPEF